MNKRCDICIDEQCDGKKNCNCDFCENKQNCHRALRPIIRITTKCTQSCSHCCWECSPKKSDFMSIRVAKQIAKFLFNNKIDYCTIMGGEFFCHPKWQELFDIILPEVKMCRLVTNGDWAKNTDFIKILIKYKQKLSISISEDNWHTNLYVAQAKKQCVENKLLWNVPTEEMKHDSTLVPIGRLKFEPTSIFGFFGTYCSDSKKKYSFLIDEKGKIYKCGFGVWNYTTIQDHLDGSFAKRFKEFNQVFYKTFISNCLRCYDAYSRLI